MNFEDDSVYTNLKNKNIKEEEKIEINSKIFFGTNPETNITTALIAIDNINEDILKYLKEVGFKFENNSKIDKSKPLFEEVK